MRRGEIYRTREKVSERGNIPGFYVIVSRDFIAENPDVSTVVCAPIYSEVLGIRSEVVLETEDGLLHRSSIRCDFLMLMFKHKLTTLVTTLTSAKQRDLQNALKYALGL